MKPPRPGYTLVEMLVAMGLLAAIFATVTMAVRTLYQVDRRMTTALTLDRSLGRFASRLRLDAHASTEVLPTADGDENPGVVFTAAEDQQFRYRVLGDGIERTVYSGETIRHRDVYRLPTRVSVAWEVLHTAEATSMAVTVAEVNGAPSSHPRHFHATLNLVGAAGLGRGVDP